MERRERRGAETNAIAGIAQIAQTSPHPKFQKFVVPGALSLSPQIRPQILVPRILLLHPLAQRPQGEEFDGTPFVFD